MSRIKIFSRVRPTSKPFKGLHLSEADSSVSINIGFQDNISKRPQSRYSQAPPSSHTFKFAHVFDQSDSQEEIFEHVARHMIDNFLGGYNGTIFAYGQTSSGKTHTIEGSSRSYVERGLIPRTISYVFEDVERRLALEEDMTVQVSYMEIYQDVGYDLLNPGTRPGALMVTLPKVGQLGRDLFVELGYRKKSVSHVDQTFIYSMQNKVTNMLFSALSLNKNLQKHKK